MIASTAFPSFVLTHILQFSIAIALVGLLIPITARRWPHFTFLICMLALAKCLVPPLITSPAGLFTRHSGLAFAPQLDGIKGDQLVWLKQYYASDECSVWESQSTVVTTVGPSTEFSLPSVGTLLLGAWFAGFLVVCLRAGWQFLMLQRVLRHTRPAPAHVEELATRIRAQLQLKREVPVVVSEQNFGPACVGALQPKLVLPRVLVSRWSDRLLQPVLAHELVHARRGDIVWGYLQFLAQLVWWFHPLVWWLGRRASLLCERCCDEEVVASVDCSPGDYAESLVRVLELKNAFRVVPLCQAMSPVEITSQRLERLMKRYGKFSKGTSGANWVIVALMAAVLIPGMQWAQAQEADEIRPDEKEYRAKINAAIEHGEWGKAIGLLEPVVEQDPNNGSATFFLGYVLHASGKIDEALVYHKKAAEFPELKPIATYNWACALALQGKRDEALAKLEESIDAGFEHESDLIYDADLKSLFETEKFKELRSRTKNGRAKSKGNGDFDFWVGRWSVMNANGDLLGTNVVTSSDKGHVITEKWTSRGGGTGTSINFYHPQKGKWCQTWVDDKGGVIEYEGDFVDGKMTFKGTMFAATGKRHLSRMTFTPKDDGTVEQFIEQSENGGKTWEVYFKGSYHPKASKSETVSF